MTSYHKMIVALSVLGLIAFLAWNETVATYLGTQDQSSEEAIELPRPTMEGPRGPFPRTPSSTWVQSDDYPWSAIRNEFEGWTGFRLTVSELGEATSCEVSEPSGHPELDRRACNAIMTRARFYPALDNDGRPTEGAYQSRVVWKLTD